jgi:hypothetical protein
LKHGHSDKLIYHQNWARALADDKQRSMVKKECLDQARDILIRHWDAVDALAIDLIELGWTPGGEAHRIIRQAIGETDPDWRLPASNVKE